MPGGPIAGIGGGGGAIGVVPQTAPALITSYSISTGILSGSAPPFSLVVMRVGDVYGGSTLANSSGQWSIATQGVMGYKVSVAAVPVGTIVAFGLPGATTFSTPGNVLFPVPNYNTLVIEGVGAGAAGTNGTAYGGNGSASTVGAYNLSAGGGTSGNGVGGTATGGDVNTTGGAGTSGPNGSGGAGAGPGGGAGGLNSTGSAPGAAPGGGGGAINGNNFFGGGGGAYFRKTFTAGQANIPLPGTNIAGVVGAGGAAAAGGSGVGGSGSLTFTWS